jgi:hypothetical protein
MSMGLQAYTSVGSGTLQTGTGTSSACAVVPNASTLAGDLVVVVCAGGAPTGTQTIEDLRVSKDLGDGWVLLSSGYDLTNGFGIFLAACIAPRAGSSGYAGIGFNNNTFYYTAQSHTFRIRQPAWIGLDQFGRDNGWIEYTASGTPLDAPAINQPYQQVIDLVGRGYNNGGTTTTVGNITNFTERFDTGSAASYGGVVLNDRTAAITGAVQNPSVTSSLAVAKTYRMGVRAMIPILGNTYCIGRMRGGRRILG